MQTTIVKEELLIRNSTCDVTLPAPFRILTVHEQLDRVMLWALIRPADTPITRRFRICLTGREAPDDAYSYVGTVFLQGGHLVYHVFVANSTVPL